MAEDKNDNQNLPVEVNKVSQKRLKNASLWVGMIGVAVSAVILIFVCKTYTAQRKFQEASVFPSLIVEIVKRCQEESYKCYFTEDQSTGMVFYEYIMENKSPFSIKQVRIESEPGPSKENDIPYLSPGSSEQAFTFAPGEKSTTVGKFLPSVPDWKKIGLSYLHIRVDFYDPNNRAFVYKKTYFMEFKNYKRTGTFETWVFNMGWESSSLELLEEEKHNKRKNTL